MKRKLQDTDFENNDDLNTNNNNTTMDSHNEIVAQQPSFKKIKRLPYYYSANENKKFLVSHRQVQQKLSIGIDNPNGCGQYEWLEKFIVHCNQTEKQYYIYLLPPGDALVVYCPSYLPYHTMLYKALWQELGQLDMNQPLIYGKPTPREMQWQTLSTIQNHTGYTFSGQKQPNHKMTKKVKTIMQQFDGHLGDLGLNSVLINRYRKEKVYDKNGKWIQGAGKDSILDHKDDEGIFGENPVILSLSLGQPRKFVIKCDKPQNNTHDNIDCDGVRSKKHHRHRRLHIEFPLGQGDVLIMAGSVNKYCTHSVPKELKLDTIQNRYNLTFRKVI